MNGNYIEHFCSNNSFSMLFPDESAIQNYPLRLLKMIRRALIYLIFKFIISSWRKALKKNRAHHITASKGCEMSQRTIMIIICLTLAFDLAGSESCGNTQNQVKFLIILWLVLLFKNKEQKLVFSSRFLKSCFPLFFTVVAFRNIRVARNESRSSCAALEALY